jgi:plastocyanin
MRVACLVVVLLLTASACSSTPSAPSPAATVTIGASGIAPREVRVETWDSVTFVNTDVRPHSIVSDPVDLHSQCPAINRVGTLQPGERRETGALSLKANCGFHDHISPGDAAYQGRIVVE